MVGLHSDDFNVNFVDFGRIVNDRHTSQLFNWSMQMVTGARQWSNCMLTNHILTAFAMQIEQEWVYCRAVFN